MYAFACYLFCLVNLFVCLCVRMMLVWFACFLVCSFVRLCGYCDCQWLFRLIGCLFVWVLVCLCFMVVCLYVYLCLLVCVFVCVLCLCVCSFSVCLFVLLVCVFG